jgi:hypothetical protein
VFDPFLGGGTTAVACLRNRRRFLGIDARFSYVQLAIHRTKAEEEKGADPLALTIILFIAQSVLRKREEAILLHLNLLVDDVVVKHDLSQDTLGTTIAKNVKLITDRLDKVTAQLNATAEQ